jgi:hypothetical protein
MGGEPAAVAVDGAGLGARRCQRRVGPLLGSLQHALRDRHVLERQVVLVGAQLLGARAELPASQIVDDQLQPASGLLDLGQHRGALRERRLGGRQRGLRAREHGLQRGDVFKRGGGGHWATQAQRRRFEAPPRAR